MNWKNGLLVLMLFALTVHVVAQVDLVTAKEDFYNKLFDTKENEELVVEENAETYSLKTREGTYLIPATTWSVTKTDSLTTKKTFERKLFVFTFNDFDTALKIKGEIK